MTDDSFGDVPENDEVQTILLAVPLKPLNLIEFQLGEMLDEDLSLCDIGIPFLSGETGELENPTDYVAQFGRELTATEAQAIRNILNEPLMAKFRKPLIIARELGPTATLEEYHVACELEGVDPII